MKPIAWATVDKNGNVLTWLTIATLDPARWANPTSNSDVADKADPESAPHKTIPLYAYESALAEREAGMPEATGKTTLLTTFNISGLPDEPDLWPNEKSGLEWVEYARALRAHCYYQTRGAKTMTSDTKLLRDKMWCEAIIATQYGSSGRMVCDVGKLLHYFNTHRVDAAATAKRGQ